MDDVDGECQACGADILVAGMGYADGQELLCPDCGERHWVCCDSETPVHLHGPAD